VENLSKFIGSYVRVEILLLTLLNMRYKHN